MSYGHAILGPSSAYRWITCTPSARFEEQIPNEESDYAAEGTLAHELAALILSARAGIYTGGTAEYNRLLDEIVSNEWYTEAMYDHAEDYAAFVKDQGGIILIEQKFDLSRYIPLGFGTSDATNIYSDLLIVNDLKYGEGVRVYAEENRQMMIYGLGALTKVHEMGYKPETVRLNIFQPRAGGATTWDISANDLIYWGDTELIERGNLAIAGRGDFVAGNHCQFCRARTSCKAYFDMFSDIEGLVDKRAMTPAELLKVITTGPLIASWIKKVEIEVMQNLQKGRTVKGLKLVAGRKARAYKSEDEVVAELISQGFDTADIFDVSLKALTNFEKDLGKNKFSTVFAGLIHETTGRPNVALETDPRPGLKDTGANVYD